MIDNHYTGTYLKLGMVTKIHNGIHTDPCHLLYLHFQSGSFPPVWSQSNTVPAPVSADSTTGCPSPSPVPVVSLPNQ